jgi:hypothetical protein
LERVPELAQAQAVFGAGRLCPIDIPRRVPKLHTMGCKVSVAVRSVAVGNAQPVMQKPKSCKKTAKKHFLGNLFLTDARYGGENSSPGRIPGKTQ